ncbi:hypothetical protein H0A61_00087 [Koleobacter methoxysyntrophicus]|jgi:hypothetical protein|uniref:DUF8052 domain-containing protein n=1 Tax=Koleobacter methoxysyntrophicus TaxID=2751313 RepID=A0A8A0RH21_9FIRM|nr:hypothetical protein [Koleobacter methoxysyntrophicus]QSQ07771.1 hypothetical protein H0A61_00087 [Koleobacter methoxysyntrophicus]
MNFKEYKIVMRERLMRYFDVEEDYYFGGDYIDLFASSNIRNEKYFAVKNIKIWGFENNEYCLIKHFDKRIDIEIVKDYQGLLKDAISKFVNPHDEHMSSIITGVMAVECFVPEDVLNTVTGFKYSRSFCFGFKGWCDLRLILVDLINNKVYGNKKAKEVMGFYLPERGNKSIERMV